MTKIPHVPNSATKTSRVEQEIQLDFCQHNPADLYNPSKYNSPYQNEKFPEGFEGLHGYVFFVGALFQSENKPKEYGTQLYTGDGMVYRLGFENGRAILKTRIMKTPCYYADLAIQHYCSENYQVPQSWFAKKYPFFSYWESFRNGGQARSSLTLGARNQLNTAFLRVGDRLWVTIDGGRPHEIDPDSLELIEPMGLIKDWLGIFPINSSKTIFDAHINSAHPAVDLSKLDSKSKDQEIYTTNYSTGYNGWGNKTVNQWLDKLSKRRATKETEKKQMFGRYTDLLRYCPNQKTLERWRLQLPDGNPVIVQQSLHQLAITENHIIMADISFRMEFSQIFAPFFFGFLKLSIFNKNYFKWVGSLIQSVFLKPTPPMLFNNLYIAKRDQLKDNGGTIDAPKPLTVQQVKIPLEISHFAADYIDSDDKITLHIGHSVGWDVTEWITRYDSNVPSKPHLRNQPDELEGMMVGTLDLGCFGRYVINTQTNEIEESQHVIDWNATWSPTVYTHQDLCRDDPEKLSETTVKNIYWMSWGFSWELIPERIYKEFKERKRRVVCFEDLPEDNKSVTLLRLDTQAMKIVDQYAFPAGYFACSPQFIPSSLPCPSERDPSVHGFIACIVIADDDLENHQHAKDEFWIFDANDLKKAPLRLRSADHPNPLNLALALHTTWLKGIYLKPEDKERIHQLSLAERRAAREKFVKQDYENILDSIKGERKEILRELFDTIIYPNFIEQTLETTFETELYKEQN
ncbi:carotenoid oxygenase family protein [Pseudanabaena sp. ABRG5-3]|uniref:carotenoid oxygenase family protein n=1 Tax=Pseudanabaena sp. ABRG5-3 TaxID=685565 RepID=UPI000DC73D7E|nr:carotenoid oxygenase family protein [Pseudanabaena sp. ABRG5-3]BBC26061.1 carotenoid oxygenase [Pseudanabaena sp. ABRG5-3]